MSTPATFDPDDVILDGIVVFVEAMGGSRQIAQAGGLIYRSVAEGIRGAVQPSDTCAIAFPSMVVGPSLRTECFVAVLTSTVVVAWRRGLVRKTTESVINPRDSITAARVHAGDTPSTKGATLLTVEGEMTVTFALPQGKRDVGDLIRSSILAS